MNKALLRFFFAALMLSAACAAFAKPQAPDRERFMAELKPYQHRFLVKDLDLSKEQAREFLPVYDKMNEALDRAAEETRALERNTLDNEQASDTELEAAAQAVFELKQKEAKIEMEYFEKFKEVLSPRQLLQLKNSERRFTQSLIKHHRRLSRDRADMTEDSDKQ